MILDPSFENKAFFLQSLVRHFGIPVEAPVHTLPAGYLREALEKFLFQKGVVENKTVILIIDEAQKLDSMSLEELRLLLNYETNQYKLLQLVLLGQSELAGTISQIPNFYDRINFKSTLNPLGFEEMKEMVYFRIAQVGYRARMDLFLEDALKEIHNYTRGYPRQVTMLCHRALKQMLIQNRAVVDGRTVDEILAEDIRSGWQRTNHLVQSSSY
jgi:general secretion pathway protein A